MKIPRSELKSIVKECLLEILSEGIGQKQQQPVSRQPSIMETLQRRQAPPKQPSRALAEAIRAEAGGNKVMESIFADTAQNTLPKMLGGERAAPSAALGLAEKITDAATPDQIFGEEVSSKWASLAFSDSPRTKSRE